MEGFIPYFNIEQSSTSFNFLIVLDSYCSSYFLYICISSFKDSSILNNDFIDLALVILTFCISTLISFTSEPNILFDFDVVLSKKAFEFVFEYLTSKCLSFFIIVERFVFFFFFLF